ncbi:MAG: hypothetical protein WEB58_16265 [Planctomycetaceae bacterium]
MSHDEDDDWDDEPEDDEDDEGDVTNCPACRAEVYDEAESCPSCGHWFLSDDREAMRRTTRRRGARARSPLGGHVVKIVIVLLVMALLMGLLM